MHGLSLVLGTVEVYINYEIINVNAWELVRRTFEDEYENMNGLNKHQLPK